MERSTTTLRGLISAQHLARHQHRRALAVARHRAQHHVGEGERLLDVGTRGQHGGHAAARLARRVAQRLHVLVEQRDLRRPGRGRRAPRSGPSTPAPRITKLAGGTPGAPPSRMPLPPNSFRSRLAPTVTARLPAISDMLVRTGACPASSSMASRPTAVIPRSSSARRSSGRAVGSAQKANTVWLAAEQAVVGGAGANTDATSSAAGERLQAREGDGRPRGLVVGVGVAGARRPRPSPPRPGGRAAPGPSPPTGVSATRCSPGRVSRGMPMSTSVHRRRGGSAAACARAHSAHAPSRSRRARRPPATPRSARPSAATARAPHANASSFTGMSALLSRRAWRMAARNASAGRRPRGRLQRAQHHDVLDHRRAQLGCAISLRGHAEDAHAGPEARAARRPPSGRRSRPRPATTAGPNFARLGALNATSTCGRGAAGEQHLVLRDAHVGVRRAAARLGAVARDVGGVEALVDRGPREQHGRGLRAVAARRPRASARRRRRRARAGSRREARRAARGAPPTRRATRARGRSSARAHAGQGSRRHVLLHAQREDRDHLLLHPRARPRAASCRGAAGTRRAPRRRRSRGPRPAAGAPCGSPSAPCTRCFASKSATRST